MRRTRRDFLRWTTGVAIGSVAAARAGGKPRRPNVLLILADDLGEKSLSCFGATVPTPNLDKLAAGGMVFRNAHAAPMCAPTRDEMFTGLSRARFAGRPGAETPFFTHRLAKLGYATGMAGKWFVGSVFDPPLRGFDESLILVNGYRYWAPDVMVFGSRSFAPQLLGRKGTPREWFIGFGAHESIWLDRVRAELGKPNLKADRPVWVHGSRFKLYRDGRFYDLKDDLAEARRIPPGKGTPEAEAARAKYQAILDGLQRKKT